MELGYTFRKSALDKTCQWIVADQGLIHICEDTKKQISYKDIQSIRLQFQPYNRYRHNNYRCRITAYGTDIDVLSTSYVDFSEFTDKAKTYTPFIKTLVRKTKSENPDCIIYLGQKPAAFNGNILLVVTAIVFALVLLFSFPIGEGRILGVLLIVIGAWHYLRMSFSVNRPQIMEGYEIPDYVLPYEQKDENLSSS